MSSVDETIPTPVKGEDPPVRPPVLAQNYDQLRRQARISDKLFEDPDFPATNSSLYYSRAPPRPFEWKRPKEISNDPQLFTNEASRFDIVQGMLGNCWGSITSLALHENLLYKVVPKDQGFGRGYAGIFHFRFWQYGQWVDVVIDDRLPTMNGKLIFLRSSDLNEFWSALLEKALAKLYGSYEALKGGQGIEGMTDLTGGIAESISLKKSPPKFKEMAMYTKRQSLICCSIEAKPNEIEAKHSSGLVKGHNYSVTAVETVKARTRSGEIDVPLIRVRNPWGNEREWEGPWSDKSNEWKLVSESEKRRIEVSFSNDGEFWMSYEDFCSMFTRLEVCCLGVDTYYYGKEVRNWEVYTFSGSWNSGASTAGGCRNFPKTFANNPKYTISLKADSKEDGLCSILVALMQKDRRQLKAQGGKMLTIGFAIYKAPTDQAELDKEYILYNKSIARSNTFINARENTKRFELPLGDYIIIPSTFEPEEDGDFILRVFIEGSSRAPTLPETESVRAPVPERRSMGGKFYEMFLKLAGADKVIDAYELRDLLSTAFKADLGREFSWSACRDLISVVDNEKRIGSKLTFEGFKELWVLVKGWQKTFNQYDTDKSSSLSIYEFRDLAKSAGFSLTQSLIDHCCQKFAGKDGKLPFDECLGCLARLTNVADFAKKYESDPPSTIDQWFQSLVLEGMV